MAAHSSSDAYSIEFKDIQANAMTVDCRGSFAVLAGKTILAFVNLDWPAPWGDGVSNVIRVARPGKWKISCVQCNPHPSHSHLFVIASNHIIEVCQLADQTSHVLSSLNAHTRIIRDIDWSPFDVNVFASCSMDSRTYLWDVRETKKPVQIFHSFASASQVKWNKVSTNLLATSHEGHVYIWDPRKSNSPLICMGGHLKRIHGLDWCPHNQYQFATASQDGYIRVWEYSNPQKCYAATETGVPVKRVRYTPFGVGFVTEVLPQMRIYESSLFMWKLTSDKDIHLLHNFVGHRDIVLGFQWRKRREGVRDHELVTWSRDQCLRIWRIEPYLQRLCGHEIEDSLDDGVAHYSSDMTAPTSQDQSGGRRLPAVNDGVRLTMAHAHNAASLKHEFNAVRRGLINVNIDQEDYMNGKCRMICHTGRHKVIMECSFPVGYPDKVQPIFLIVNTTLDAALRSRLLKVLNDQAYKCVSENRHCLEMCFRQMMSVMENLTDHHSTESEVSFPPPHSSIVPAMPFPSIYSLGSIQDSSVPFPSTSGARFCSNGLLVTFSVPPEMKKVSGPSGTTPKSLSELAAFTANSAWKNPGASFLSAVIFSRSPPTPTSEMSISDFFQTMGKKASHQSQCSSRRQHDRGEFGGRGLMTKKQQAVGKVVVYNAEAIISVNRELARSYHLNLDDIEGTCQRNRAVAASVGRKDLMELWSFVASIITTRLTSSHRLSGMEKPLSMTAYGRSFIQSMMIDPNGWKQVDQYLWKYANILYNWGIFNQRCQVLKCIGSIDSMLPYSQSDRCCCHKEMHFPGCTTRPTAALECSICCRIVRGLSTVCRVCGHGGHMYHIATWFETHSVCAADCNCLCWSDIGS